MPIYSAPPSKSFLQRAIFAAFLSAEKTIIETSKFDEDSLGLLKVLKSCGLVHEQLGEHKYRFWREEKPLPNELFCSESGLAYRLLLAYTSCLEQSVTLQASKSLCRRNMSGIICDFEKLGIKIDSNEDFPPLTTHGGLTSGNYTISGASSSQHISGLMMVMPLLEGNSTIHIEHPVSIPYMQMTARLLQAFGVVAVYDSGKLAIQGGQTYQEAAVNIEGDWSSAANFFVLGAIHQSLICEGLDKQSLQADRKIVEVLKSGGVQIQETSTGYEVTNSDRRKAICCDLVHSPDLFPILAIYAATADGISRLKGLHRLHQKESNRFLSVQKELANFGIRVEKEEDEMVIYGNTFTRPKRPVDTHGDHRIAMAFAVLKTFLKEDCEILQSHVVNKSYPSFWEDLKGVLLSQ